MFFEAICFHQRQYFALESKIRETDREGERKKKGGRGEGGRQGGRGGEQKGKEKQSKAKDIFDGQY